MHGTAWVAVAELVQCSPTDCSDQYHQHVQYQGTKRTGIVCLQDGAVYV